MKARKQNDNMSIQKVTAGGCKTQQHMREMCNVNKIMEKQQRTGLVPCTRLNPRYGDFSNGLSYHDSLNKLKYAEEEFELLPAQVKKRFRQDPAEIIDFLQDEKNRIEAEDLGLIPRKIVEKKVGETEKDS